LRFVRTAILIILITLKQFWLMFIILAILSTYALLYRFGMACYYHLSRTKKNV